MHPTLNKHNIMPSSFNPAAPVENPRSAAEREMVTRAWEYIFFLGNFFQNDSMIHAGEPDIRF